MHQISNLDGKGVLGGAVNSGVSLEARAEAGLTVASSPVGAGVDVFVVTSGGGLEAEEDDGSGGFTTVSDGLSEGIGDDSSAEVDVVVNLDDIPVLLLGVGTGVGVGNGGSGPRLGVDLVDSVKDSGGLAGSSGRAAGGGDGSRPEVRSVSSLSPASIDDEELVSLLEAGRDEGSSGLARGIDVGVDEVGVDVEVSNNTGLVSVGGELVVIGLETDRNFVDVDLLDNSVGGVDVVGGGVSGEVSNTELLLGGGGSVPPDKVVLSDSIVDRGVDGGGLDGMGVGTDHVDRGQGTTTEVLGGNSVVPVLDIDVVAGVSVGVSEASLKGLNVGINAGGASADGEVSEVSGLGGSPGDLLGGGDLDAGALGGEVVSVLSDDSSLEDLDVGGSGRDSSGSDGGAGSVEEVVNLELLQVTRVGVEGDGEQPSCTKSGSRSSSCSSDDDVGDDRVGEALEGIGDDLSSGSAASEVKGAASSGVPGSGDRDRVSNIVLSVVVEELEGEGSGNGRSVGEHDTGGGNASEGVVDVEGVDSDGAGPGGAVSSLISSVALASHGGILVPEGVDVVELANGKVGDSLAGSVSGARVGAGSTLASSSIVAVKALAHSGLAVAESLVGALHVVVSGIVDDGVTRISLGHQGVGLLGTVRVDGRSGDSESGSSVEGEGHVQISLGGVDVGKVEGASA